MSKIRIKNFGPIKEGYLDNDGYMDIKKVTIFIGNQGSGKSTVAKLISSFIWLEKALNRGDRQIKTADDIINLIYWQRLGSYVLDTKSEIVYIGDRYRITYKAISSVTQVEKIDNGNYIVPKIMYVPSERNILSTIKGAFDFSNLPGPLASFAEELKRAQIELDGLKLELPFENFAYEYDEYKDISYVVGNNYKIDLLDASSGLHSLIPLFLVSRNLSMKIQAENIPAAAAVSANQSVRRDREVSNVMMNKSLTGDQKNQQVEEIFAKYHNKCFINIVEEPEQNLFPTSQRATLNTLLGLNNITLENKLIMTTHSPYLINDLTLNIEAFNLIEKIKKADKASELNDKVFEIVPKKSLVDPKDVAIYEMDEKNGTISLLGNYKGLPSDENKLNVQLGTTNDDFSKLLNIEDSCR